MTAAEFNAEFEKIEPGFWRALFARDFRKKPKIPLILHSLAA
jgi:hypothetical protein